MILLWERVIFSSLVCLPDFLLQIVSRVIFFFIETSSVCFRSGFFSLRGLPYLIFQGTFFLGKESQDFCFSKYLKRNFIFFFESGRTVVDRVRCGVYFVPLSGFEFEDEYIIFLFCDILNSSEHEDEILEFKHGVSSSSLNCMKITSGVSLVSTYFHYLLLMSKIHISFKV